VTDVERIADLERQLAEALRTIEELRKELEEWKRGHRERSKRRSSRPEGTRKTTGRGPGRRAGAKGSNRPVPDRIDREVVHPVPACCPDCGGEVEAGPETQSTIVQDIPPVRPENVRHVGGVGQCKRCHKRVVAKLPGMSALGDAATQVQLGPGIVALGLSLHVDEHVTVHGVSRLFGTWFGVRVTPSGLCQLFARQAARTAPALDEVQTHVRTSAVVGMDETSIRQNGQLGWAWIARTETASLFRIELSRGAWVAEDLLGTGFQGVVCSDFYGAYTRMGDWKHGYCNAHTIREAKKIAEVTGDPDAVRFSNRLRSILSAGQLAQLSGDDEEREHVRRRMNYLIGSTAFEHLPDVVRLQARLSEHYDGVMLFVDRPDVPMTNNGSERDIRPFAMHRKVTGGTRSARGSRTLAHWMTVTQTLRKNTMPLGPWIGIAWEAHLAGRPPPSVFPAPN
jgi:transposase